MLMKLEFDRFFEKPSNIRLNESPSSGSQVVSCGWMDVMMLTVMFCNFANVPANVCSMPV
jgi:hypothetical protein